MTTDPISIHSRRDLLKSMSCGFGYVALAGLLGNSSARAGVASHPLAPKLPHFAPRAKRVIFMFMQGGPSHLDSFDFKPELLKAGNDTVDDKQKRKQLLKPQTQFRPRGKSGLPISDFFPHLSEHADDLCVLNGMHTDSPAHPQATVMVHTGSTNFVRPSMGAWVVYGLGTENENLPGFVTINPTGGGGGAQNYGSAFLPATFQGTRLGTKAGSIANIRNPRLSAKEQREQLNLLQSMNRDFLGLNRENKELEGVIESYELAYRMQTAVPNVLDLAKEPDSIKERYGINEKATEDFGMQCLMARRLAEEGVRFIQVTSGGWDHHNSLQKRMGDKCASIDQPIATLIQDLKDRGMFEDTLIIWGGEFGRSPDGQNGGGRRHNNRGYSMWLAGGGVKGGLRYGSTDPLGGTAVSDKLHTHDLHATILYLLGLDHEGLTYRYAGRDFRLTDVHGTVAHDIVA